MPTEADLVAVFEALREVLAAHAKQLVVAVDEPGQYALNTDRPGPNGDPMYFGGVRLGKRYVSFYLMPVYVEPALLDEASPELHRRMQGKSCFNFTQLDKGLFKELSSLSRRGLQHFRQVGYA